MDEHTLNDLLECSVCLERLDTSSKVLPCQHTFCRKCLEVIVSSRQELRCPECRVLVEVKIDDLPPNVLLMRILEGMKNAAAAKLQQQKMYAPKTSNIDCIQLQQMQNSHKNLQQSQSPKHLQLTTQSNTQPQQQSQPQVISGNSNTNSGIQQHSAQQTFAQQRLCMLPHAYALYDFDSSEPSDLHFKKGDLVLLKRKIDINWYVGQLNNGNGVVTEGTFPINHVQVIVPLPTPQCAALYDFKMPPNEEQGCLTFKKGTIIHVLRRVDHNWAEGCIGSAIGIFPIAFVELNALAKQVLEGTYMNANALSSVNSVTATSAASALNPPPHCLRNPPPMPLLDVNSSDSTTSSSSPSNSSSNATSPHSVSTATTTTSTNVGINFRGGVNSTSMPNSPNQSLPASPQHEIASSSNIGSGSSSVRFRDKREKRHSLNALLSAGALYSGLGTSTTLSILQSNRHSAEILSVPNDAPTSTEVSRQQLGCSSGGGQEGASVRNTAMPQSNVAREQQQHTHQQQPQQQAQQRVNVLKTSTIQQHVPPSLPWGYLALYPYKPRKSDELELKKGCVYIVTERCLDGWFKGKNWQDITGVFPGNYVTPLRSRDQQQLMHQWKYVPLQSTHFSSNPCGTIGSNADLDIQSQSVVTSTSQRLQSLHQPPDLPPRQISGTLPISSVWTKPLGHTVEAFFNRYSKTHDNSKENAGKERPKENTPCVSTNAAPTSVSSSTTSSAVQLMKRLAHIKSRSKSPSTAFPRQQQKNPHSQQSNAEKSTLGDPNHNSTKNSTSNAAQKTNTHVKPSGAHGQLHPVHVRSGSCPSQLLQSLPHDLAVSTSIAANAPAMTQIQENVHKIPQQASQQKQQQQIQQISPQSVGYGSQQLRGAKERHHIQQHARKSIDASILRSIYNSTGGQQQQQAQQQQQQLVSTKPIMANHRKSQSLDAATALSGVSNDCGAVTGDSSGSVATLATPYNITAAAVAASATTKSTQCSRESRFRCIVPYPPNTEIELELQVGDIIYVQRRQKNGWYKGTHARTNKTGLFPASFVEPDI